jgi:hypothetical protein
MICSPAWIYNCLDCQIEVYYSPLMKTVSSTTQTRNRRRVLIGIGISLIAVLLLIRFFDWQQVWDVLRHADYRFLLLAIPLYLLSYGLRAMAWSTILQEKVSFRRVFLTMNIGYLLNNLLPFRLGELGRALLLGQDGLGFWMVFSTILIERALDLILAAGLLLGTLPFVLSASNAGQIALIVGTVVLMGLALLYLLARNRCWALAQLERLEARWPRLARFGHERLAAFLSGLETLTSPGRFLRVFGWLFSTWAAAAIVQYWVLRSFYPQARLVHAAFGLAVSALGVAVPSSPGYIGVYEAAWVGALALFEIPFSTAFAHALTTHLYYVIITGIFGILGLADRGERLGQVFARVSDLKLGK